MLIVVRLSCRLFYHYISLKRLHIDYEWCRLPLVVRVTELGEAEAEGENEVEGKDEDEGEDVRGRAFRLDKSDEKL